MSRKPRIWFPGATYHITARGNRRASLFYDHQDYQKYLDLLALCKKDIPFSLHAYCLMTNHIHLLLETKDEPPGTIIKFIHTRYAVQFNKRYDLTGHVFQGRFHSKLIDSVTYFLKASKYIHLNPLEANLVTEPEQYRWSSYTSYANPAKNNPLLETERILTMFDEPRHQQYHEYVKRCEEENTLTL